MHIFLSILVGVFACRTIAGCSCPCDDTGNPPGPDTIATVRGTDRKAQNAVLQDLFYKLLMTMERGYHPPMWISKFDLSPYLSRTIVYYDELLSEAKQMMFYREPCRIGGEGKYDEKKFENFFNYKESLISWKTTTSIAIYTFTPIRLSDDEYTEVNIVSVFWPHLEDPSLPDRGALSNVPEQERRRFLSNYFHGIFSKILRCVVRNRMERIVFADFGISESIRVARETFNVDFVEILQDVFRKYFAGVPSLSVGETHIPATEVSTRGSLPDVIREIKISGKLERTLFVNSASPVALLGNGHQQENSTNGILGRMTAISVLGWSVTNKNIYYELVLPDLPNADINQVD